MTQEAYFSRKMQNKILLKTHLRKHFTNLRSRQIHTITVIFTISLLKISLSVQFEIKFGTEIIDFNKK